MVLFFSKAPRSARSEQASFPVGYLLSGNKPLRFRANAAIGV